jgi:predicted phosphodiesterase
MPTALQPLWQGATHLILNGDVAEIHHPRHRARAARQTLELFDLCDRDGVELILLSGNHDPYLSDQRHLYLADGNVFVTHGDAMHPAIAPWSPAAARMRRAYDRGMAALEHEDRDRLEARLDVAQHASHIEWAQLDEEASHTSVRSMLIRPWALVQVLHYWSILPRLAAQFAHDHAPRASFVVIGHSHRAGVWTHAGRVIINTGSFGFPGRPQAVVIESGQLQVIPVKRKGPTFHLAQPCCVYSLEQVESAPPDPSTRNTRPINARPSAVEI